jgi:hypothetical protein
MREQIDSFRSLLVAALASLLGLATLLYLLPALLA